MSKNSVTYISTAHITNPNTLFLDEYQLLRAFNAFALRITDTLDVELLVRDQDEPQDLVWMDVTALEAPHYKSAEVN